LLLGPPNLGSVTAPLGYTQRRQKRRIIVHDQDYRRRGLVHP
jgi:hypothetical protein